MSENKSARSPAVAGTKATLHRPSYVCARQRPAACWLRTAWCRCIEVITPFLTLRFLNTQNSLSALSLSVCLSVSVLLSLRLCLSVCLCPGLPSICLSVSVCLSLCPCLPLCLSVCLCPCLSLSVCLSVCVTFSINFLFLSRCSTVPRM